jgi:hypothetical protein
MIDELRLLYTELLIKCIGNSIYGDAPISPGHSAYNRELRETGQDWPSVAHSMAGIKRLRNLRDLVQITIDENIPGHYIETGVWRGGSCILMRGVLAANGVGDRNVYVADSFEGLPKPNSAIYPQDKDDQLYTYEELSVPLEQVKANFAAYDLLDDRVVFVKGFFQDTLVSLETGPLALIRLDGDMYESTIVSLEALYPRLSRGGFVIIDDYGAIPACRGAVTDYRERNNIDASIHDVDWTGVFWRKP